MTRFLTTVLIILSCYTSYCQRRSIPATDSFSITGNIRNPKVVRIADIIKCRQERLDDIIIRNHKGEPRDTLKNIVGTSLKTFLNDIEPIADKPKEYSEYYIVFIASDGYRNVYSWNEIFNTDIGNHIFIVTEANGLSLPHMDQRILVMSMADINTGRRHLKSLSKIEFRKVE